MNIKRDLPHVKKIFEALAVFDCDFVISFIGLNNKTLYLWFNDTEWLFINPYHRKNLEMSNHLTKMLMDLNIKEGHCWTTSKLFAQTIKKINKKQRQELKKIVFSKQGNDFYYRKRIPGYRTDDGEYSPNTIRLCESDLNTWQKLEF